MKKFCIPFNGDIECAKKIVDEFGEYIYEFFGTNGNIPSAVGCSKKPEDREFVLFIEYLLDNNIYFNYTLNSLYPYYYLANDKYKETGYYIKDIGIKSVTVTEPFFGKWFSEELGLEVSNSTLTDVFNETKIKRLIDLGFKRIIINEDYTKRIDILKYLGKVVPKNIKLELMSNNGCKKDCIHKKLHYIIHDEDILKQVDIGKNICGMTLEESLMSPKIRFKDVKRYEEIGISLFKLAGRNLSSDKLLPNIRNFFNDELIWMYIPEQFFDGFFDFLFEKGCNDRCSECGFCKQYAEKLEHKFY